MVWHLDVGLSHPGAEKGSKGLAVRVRYVFAGIYIYVQRAKITYYQWLTNRNMWVQIPPQQKFDENNTHILKTGYQKNEAGYKGVKDYQIKITDELRVISLW